MAGNARIKLNQILSVSNGWGSISDLILTPRQTQ